MEEKVYNMYPFFKNWLSMIETLMGENDLSELMEILFIYYEEDRIIQLEEITNEKVKKIWRRMAFDSKFPLKPQRDLKEQIKKERRKETNNKYYENNKDKNEKITIDDCHRINEEILTIEQWQSIISQINNEYQIKEYFDDKKRNEIKDDIKRRFHQKETFKKIGKYNFKSDKEYNYYIVYVADNISRGNFGFYRNENNNNELNND